jgi:hypothetical protein
MLSWFSKNLGNGVVALGPTQDIMNAFTPLFAAAGLPIDMALFSGHDERRNIIIYFSPGASKLANICGAQPCEKPGREDLALLVGHSGAWEHFDPNPQATQ